MCVALRIVLICSIIVCTSATARISNGQPIDTLRRFPHHVTIQTDVFWNIAHGLCGGSIVSNRWILTSALCVEGSERLQMHFKKLYYTDFTGSFTVVVNKDEVHMHPAFDIAMIHIPVLLEFSNYIKPVRMSRSSLSELENRFAVMPGFDAKFWYTPIFGTTPAYTPAYTAAPPTAAPPTVPPTAAPPTAAPTAAPTPAPSAAPTAAPTLSPGRARALGNDFNRKNDVTNRSLQSQQLTYGMFKVLSNSKCSSGSLYEFDEFLQICCTDYGSSNHCQDYGSGLLVGWPADPQIVGIYSFAANNCYGGRPSVYTSVSEFLPWIESVMNE